MLRFRKGLVALVVTVLIVSMFSMPVYAAKGSGGGGGGKPAPTTPSVISYVALGDSIATGTVTNWSNITSYVEYFYQYLKSYYGRKTTVTKSNFAHDGHKSSDLLALLTAEASELVDAVKTADVITISIGGNNLMQAAAIPGFTDIDWPLADQGVADFATDWPQIIARIKSLNTKSAKIIVATLYNPYNIEPPVGYEADEGLHDQTDLRMSVINGVITNNTSLGYGLADAQTAFHQYAQSTMGQVTYFYPSLLMYLLRNPHPTAAGQQILTDLHKKAFLSMVQ
ncbi:MAG: GDSL-type esterase/lipase family protein [Bacillota bacterium]